MIVSQKNNKFSGSVIYLINLYNSIHKIEEQRMNDIFSVEYTPNHSGSLLTSNPDLMIKKMNHKIGSERKNFKVLEATI